MVHVAIVGAYGSAGVAVADELLERVDSGALGPPEESPLELTLIDHGDPGGGLCILEGCMPSKDVLSAAAHRYQARHDPRLERTPVPDPEAIVATKDEHVDAFASHRREHVHSLAEREDVTFLDERARFVDDRVLAVGERILEPDYVVIATGSVVNVPDLPGIDEVEFLTSADVLEATAFPDSAIVMGFGFVGMELVPYLSEVGGVDLTVIEHDDRPLDTVPPEYGHTLADIYENHFDVTIVRNATERRLEPTEAGGVRLDLDRDRYGGVDAENPETETLEADALYLFTGRRPNVETLGLAETAIEPGTGWVDSTMQARDDEWVFIVGDVNGREPILHVAKEQGFAAGANVVRHHRGEPLEPYTNVPHHVVFSGLSVYPYVRIGHTPETVAETNMDAVVVTREASDDGVFAVKNHPEGLATLVVDRESGTVLGYLGLHLHADVMAKTMQVAVEMGLDVRELPDRAYHPTTPEILDGLFREAAAEVEETSS